ncbi:tyrosine-type recombinase/integrase [Vagococcus teuberi]
MKFTNERNYLLLLILVDTGLRISEIMNLKQYHIEEYQIKVENGKGKKDRVVHCYLTVLLRDIDKYVDFSFIYLLV